jgi:hypothetical protein
MRPTLGVRQLVVTAKNSGDYEQDIFAAICQARAIPRHLQESIKIKFPFFTLFSSCSVVSICMTDSLSFLRHNEIRWRPHSTDISLDFL